MSKQSKIKYDRLLEVASRQFSEFGYRSVTLDEIAKEAGISKMTIYKHFATKEELFIETILSFMHKHAACIEEELKSKTGTIEKIDHLMKYNLETSKNFSLSFYKDVMSMPNVTESVMAKKLEYIRRIYRGIVNEGVLSGEIREMDVDFATEMLIVTTQAYGEKFINAINSLEDIRSSTEKFYDFLKYGLFGGNGGGKIV